MHCEVIVCSLCHHDVVGCYDAIVLAKIEQEMQIIKVKLQHQTSKREHVKLYVGHAGMQVKVCYMHQGYIHLVIYMSFDVMVTYLIDAS